MDQDTNEIHKNDENSENGNSQNGSNPSEDPDLDGMYGSESWFFIHNDLHYIKITVAQKTAPIFAYYIKTHVLLNADII